MPAELRVADGEHYEHHLDLGSGEQPFDRVPQHRLAPQRRILLRSSDPEAGTRTGGRDQTEIPRTH